MFGTGLLCPGAGGRTSSLTREHTPAHGQRGRSSVGPPAVWREGSPALLPVWLTALLIAAFFFLVSATPAFAEQWTHWSGANWNDVGDSQYGSLKVLGVDPDTNQLQKETDTILLDGKYLYFEVEMHAEIYNI